MRRYLTGSVLISTAFLAACAETQIEYVPVVPDVPADLRQPVTVPVRQTDTLRDVALVLTDHVEALETANGRIIATDCILTAAERGTEPDCLQNEGD